MKYVITSIFRIFHFEKYSWTSLLKHVSIILFPKRQFIIFLKRIRGCFINQLNTQNNDNI